MMLALIDAAGFRSAAQLTETEFAAALIAGLLPPAVGVVNGVPHWSSAQADEFLNFAERTVLARHSHMANALINGASEVRSTPTRSAPKPKPFADPAIEVGATTHKPANVERPINEPHDEERFPEDMAADYLGMSAEVLRLAREGGTGPAWTKNGTGKVIYRFGDLRAFKAERDRIETKHDDTRPLMDTHEAARYIGLTAETLKGYRRPSHQKFGPPWIKQGYSVFYRPADLDAWIAHHRFAHEVHGRQDLSKAPKPVAPVDTAPKPKPDKRLTAKQAAKYLKVSNEALSYYRLQRDGNVAGRDHGPPFERVGRLVFYMRSDIDAWIAGRGKDFHRYSAAGRKAIAGNAAKARAAKAAKKGASNRVTVGQSAISAESQARKAIVERIEACGKQAKDFDNALTHGKATLGAKIVLKAGTEHAHSRMPIVPSE